MTTETTKEIEKAAVAAPKAEEKKARPRFVQGKTARYELDLRDRMLLLRAVRHYYDSSIHARCQQCGRPDKDEQKALRERNLNVEASLIARLEEAIESDYCLQVGESIDYDYAVAVDTFNRAAQEAQEAKRLVMVDQGADGRQIPRMYVDQGGKRVVRPRQLPADYRSVEILARDLGSLEVVLPDGIARHCVKALDAMHDWAARDARDVSHLNAKFGVGVPGKDSDYPKESFEAEE
jgi:hypothetical protein